MYVMLPDQLKEFGINAGMYEREDSRRREEKNLQSRSGPERGNWYAFGRITHRSIDRAWSVFHGQKEEPISRDFSTYAAAYVTIPMMGGNENQEHAPGHRTAAMALACIFTMWTQWERPPLE
jgi:hypothetical protein